MQVAVTLDERDWELIALAAHFASLRVVPRHEQLLCSALFKLEGQLLAETGKNLLTAAGEWPQEDDS